MALAGPVDTTAAAIKPAIAATSAASRLVTLRRRLSVAGFDFLQTFIPRYLLHSGVVREPGPPARHLGRRGWPGRERRKAQWRTTAARPGRAVSPKSGFRRGDIGTSTSSC